MKHYNHIIRFAVILVLAVMGFLLVRSFLVPESFGIHGTYKYGFTAGIRIRNRKPFRLFTEVKRSAVHVMPTRQLRLQRAVINPLPARCVMAYGRHITAR